MVREWLVRLTEATVLGIDFMALLVIAFATVEAFVGGLQAIRKSGHERRQVWLRYARWLIAGMTFQLASDVLETAVRMSWTALGQLAVVAVVRTFLNYFLERDVGEVRSRQKTSMAKPVRAED